MAEFKGTYEAHDGLKIFYRAFPAKKPKAGIVLAHGLGEHSGRYAPVVDVLGPLGYSFWMVDHRGHGKSEGARGHVLQFDHYLKDLQNMVELAGKEIGPNKKLYLLGHSMGGLIAISFALKNSKMLDGLIVSSPALGMRVKVPLIKEKLGLLMSNIWPSLSMGNELDTSKISHDSQVVQDYENDPLVHDRVTARWFTEFLAAMKNAQDNAAQLRLPILMQVAGDDHLVDTPSSRAFFDKLNEKDKTLHDYESLYHELYHETDSDRQQVLADLKAWLEDHVT